VTGKKMRTNYTCVGGYIDIEGLALVRFDLVDHNFRILKTVIETVPTYDVALKRIDELAALEATIDIETIDVLSNFGSTLKNHIIQNHKTEHQLRVKTTPVGDQKEDMVLNLMNIMNREKIKTDDSLAITALSEIRQPDTRIDKQKLKNVYEGNDTLNSVLEAILHSIAWLESQMVKHNV